MKINNHIFKGEVNVAKTWEPHIKEMIVRFDRELRIPFIPKFLSNLIVRFRKKNKIVKIKSSFGMLKVEGEFSPDIKWIIENAKTKCKNTCEFCGSDDTSSVTIKGWVYTCCKKCKDG